MMEVKDPQNFEYLKKRITKLADFDCSHYSDSFLKRRIEVRLRNSHLDSYMEYAMLLSKSVEEREKLSKEMSINVTNFFRDASMWGTVITDVIPTMIDLKKMKGQTNLKVWCAGCSSGEEPLSVAICFLETLGPGLSGFNLNILGTDMDPIVIKKAKNGLYEEPQFKEMSLQHKIKYFDQVEEGLYKAKKEIMDLVHYKGGDVLSIFKPRNLDLIFCRNIVIYFSLSAKSKLYEDLHDCLSQGGFFIMGKTETIMGPARTIFQVFNAKERIFCRE